MLLIDTVKQYLTDSGLIGDYNPIIFENYSEGNWGDGDFIVVITTNGSTSDVHSIDANYTLEFITKQSATEVDITKALTDLTLMRQYVFENNKYDCIINDTSITNEISRTYEWETGRFSYNFSFGVKTTPRKIYG